MDDAVFGANEDTVGGRCGSIERRIGSRSRRLPIRFSVPGSCRYANGMQTIISWTLNVLLNARKNPVKYVSCLLRFQFLLLAAMDLHVSEEIWEFTCPA